MPVGEIRAQFPWQLQREDPDRGKPHARVVVEIAGLQQLLHPGIEAIDAGLPLDGPPIGTGEPASAFYCSLLACKRLAIALPDGGSRFEVALEVSPPEHFLHEFLGVLKAWRGERRLQNSRSVISRWRI